MKRIITLIIIVSIIGLVAGYFLFAKVGSSYIGVGKLLFPSRNFLEKLGGTLIGIEKIRRNILICGAAGGAVGLVLGFATGGKRRKYRR